MMKCMFALVVLLHFCCSAGNSVNLNLNREMIERLDKLNKLYRAKQLNITSPETVQRPNTDMLNNADSCVDVFTRELRRLLNTTTVHTGSENILKELKANLLLLRPSIQQNEHQCKMEQNRRSLTPFKPYSTFLKKLNARKR